MAVPKKRTSISKKNIRNILWKKKRYFTTLKAFSLAQSIFTGNSKAFFVRNTNIRIISINLIEQIFLNIKILI